MKEKGEKTIHICLITDGESPEELIRAIPKDEHIGVIRMSIPEIQPATIRLSDIFLVRTQDAKTLKSEPILTLLDGRGRKRTALIASGLKPNEVIRYVRSGFVDVFDLEAESDLIREWVLDRYEEVLRAFGKEEQPAGHDPAERIIGESHEIESVRRLCRQAAGVSALTVLIQGSTGTGKELVARVIHDLSARAHGPFVEVNCSAIPETLMESELFGYEKGAFTDARRQKKGLFELAHEGTLFLDEIGTMSLQMQNKILKTVEEKKIRRIGGDSEIGIDVKIIAGTNVNLREASEKGQFRPDLFYRLNVFTIHIPDLSSRPSDIGMLSMFFLKEINKRYGLDINGFHPSVIELLNQYAWPGNVRELKHAVERSAVMAGSGRILPSHLPEEMQKADLLREENLLENLDDRNILKIPLPPDGIALNDLDTYIIRDVLKRFNHNQSRAASFLRISRTRLIRHLPPRDERR